MVGTSIKLICSELDYNFKFSFIMLDFYYNQNLSTLRWRWCAMDVLLICAQNSSLRNRRYTHAYIAFSSWSYLFDPYRLLLPLNHLSLPLIILVVFVLLAGEVKVCGHGDDWLRAAVSKSRPCCAGQPRPHPPLSRMRTEKYAQQQKTRLNNIAYTYKCNNQLYMHVCSHTVKTRVTLPYLNRD